MVCDAGKLIMGISRIVLEPTRVTPAVIMEDGLISITGRSIPDDAANFYRPMQEWIKEYTASKWDETKVILSFEFINSSSTKWIYGIIKELARYPGVREKVTIEWHYEKGDDELYELGKIIHTFIDCPFIFYETERN